jgi:hypothetical protein
MKKYYNKQRKSIKPLEKGELVILNSQNIRAKYRWQKLEDKMLGPFEVLSVRSNLRYCRLTLPESWKFHPVCNIKLLEWNKGTQPKKQVVEIEADDEDWVMESITVSGPSEDNPKQHAFWVRWKDYTHEEDTWETYENVSEHDTSLLEKYFNKNPAIVRHGRYKAVKKKSKKQ